MMKGNIIILEILLSTCISGEAVAEGHSNKQIIKIDVTNTYSNYLFLMHINEIVNLLNYLPILINFLIHC